MLVSFQYKGIRLYSGVTVRKKVEEDRILTELDSITHFRSQTETLVSFSVERTPVSHTQPLEKQNTGIKIYHVRSSVNMTKSEINAEKKDGCILFGTEECWL